VLADDVDHQQLQRTLGKDSVGQTGELLLSLLDNNSSENTNVTSDNASTDRLEQRQQLIRGCANSDRPSAISVKTDLSLPLTSSAGTVARVARRQEQSGTGVQQHTLLHGETLTVVST